MLSTELSVAFEAVGGKELLIKYGQWGKLSEEIKQEQEKTKHRNHDDRVTLSI